MLLGKVVLKGHCHAIVVSLQKAKTCQPKNNGLVFCFVLFLFCFFFAKDYITTLNILLSSVVTGGEDGNGLKLEKIGHFFQVLNCLEKASQACVLKKSQANYYGLLSLLNFIC